MYQDCREALPNDNDYVIALSDKGDRKLNFAGQPLDQGKETSKGTKARVLLFSGMRELALYRAEVLRGKGFDVSVPLLKEDVILAIKLGLVDVVVLAYTLPNETVHEVAELLREYCPECRLVVISESGRVDRRIAPDATVIATEGPAGLIEAIRRLTDRH